MCLFYTVRVSNHFAEIYSAHRLLFPTLHVEGSVRLRSIMEGWDQRVGRVYWSTGGVRWG